MKQPPKVIYKTEPKRHSWCRWSVFRVKNRNNSVNVRFTGGTGDGKSWSALSFAELCAKMMGKIFTPDRIYFSIKEVIDDVANNEPPPGTIFFIDEQQVVGSAKNHQSKRAEAYAIFYSTIRSNRYIIITTLPFSDMELKKLRRFYHVEIECYGADLKNKTVRSTPRYLEYARSSDKVYRKRLIISFVDKDGIRKSRKLSYWDIPKPSNEIINAFELKKAEFKRKLYKKISNELAEEEGEKDEFPKAGANEDTLETLTPYQKALYDVLCKGIQKHKDIKVELEKLGFSSALPKISVNIKWMKKKGVVILKRR